MKKSNIKMAGLVGILALATVFTACKEGYKSDLPQAHAAKSSSLNGTPIYSFTLADIDGQPLPLSQFEKYYFWSTLPVFVEILLSTEVSRNCTTATKARA